MVKDLCDDVRWMWRQDPRSSSFLENEKRMRSKMDATELAEIDFIPCYVNNYVNTFYFYSSLQ